MAGLWWSAALVFMIIGALFAWGARAMTMDGLYRQACLFLALGLLCTGLGAAAS